MAVLPCTVPASGDPPPSPMHASCHDVVYPEESVSFHNRTEAVYHKAKMEVCFSCGREGLHTKELSCTHSYCTNCLFKISKSQQGFMPCPQCRKDVLHDLVAASKYRQLKGTVCSRHQKPLVVYCVSCGTMVCDLCTRLEHRRSRGHTMASLMDIREGHFKDLFQALEEVRTALGRLQDTSRTVSHVLMRNMDVTSREIETISEHVVNPHREMFKGFLESELKDTRGLLKTVKEVQRKNGNTVSDLKEANEKLHDALNSRRTSFGLPTSDYTRYIEKPLGKFKCEKPAVQPRLSISLAKPPDYFPDWLGQAIGVLWVLPKQLIVVVDERFEKGEDVRLFSFHANDTETIDWSYDIQPTDPRVRAVLCKEVYRYQNEICFWVASGNEVVQLTLDLNKDGCPIKSHRRFNFKLPSKATGISAIACKFGESYVDNTFLVTTTSSSSMLLSIYGWNGEHQEDIALAKLSHSISDMTLRAGADSLVICDAEAMVVKSYNQTSFSSREQYNFQLHMDDSDLAVPISVTGNKNGDIFILWMYPDIRKGDLVFSHWNLTAQRRGAEQVSVVTVGNSLESGIPVGISCWDHDIAVCFQDGRIKLLQNHQSLSSMTTGKEHVGQPRAFITSVKPEGRPRRRAQVKLDSSQKLRRTPAVNRHSTIPSSQC